MATKETLDFSNVSDKSGFNPKHQPEGEYAAQVVSFSDTKSKAGNKMWVFGIALNKDKRSIYPVYCTLNAESLWKLRQLLVACGISVPKKKLTVDGNRLIGRALGVALEDDEYEGKKKSVISDMFPASELSGDAADEGDDDEEPEEEEEEYEDDDQADDDSDDEPEEDDAEEDEEPEPEPAPKKVTTKKSPAPARAKRKPAPVDEDEDEMEV